MAMGEDDDIVKYYFYCKQLKENNKSIILIELVADGEDHTLTLTIKSELTCDASFLINSIEDILKTFNCID